MASGDEVMPPSIVDVLISVIPDFVNQFFSSVNVLITATPAFGVVAIPAMAVISSFILLFAMEIDS